MNPYASALVILPKVLATIPPVRRCVDVGCGDMGWLRALHELAPTAELLGVDLRSDHVPEETRHALIGAGGRTVALGVMPHLQMDLSNPEPPSPHSPWRRCGLVICLEVAEHLHPEHAETLVSFVSSLVAPMGCLLWSAATPGQGPYGEDDNPGVHHNERPHAYWEQLLGEQGFVVQADVTNALRVPHDDVDPWYTANLTLFGRSLAL